MAEDKKEKIKFENLSVWLQVGIFGGIITAFSIILSVVSVLLELM